MSTDRRRRRWDSPHSGALDRLEAKGIDDEVVAHAQGRIDGDPSVASLDPRQIDLEDEGLAFGGDGKALTAATGLAIEEAAHGGDHPVSWRIP